MAHLVFTFELATLYGPPRVQVGEWTEERAWVYMWGSRGAYKQNPPHPYLSLSPHDIYTDTPIEPSFPPISLWSTTNCFLNVCSLSSQWMSILEKRFKFRWKFSLFFFIFLLRYCTMCTSTNLLSMSPMIPMLVRTPRMKVNINFQWSGKY